MGRRSELGSEGGSRALVRTVGLAQGVALYVGAVVGSGVLILPGVAASAAGPAAILAWAFDGALGIPLALTFAALASRYPDAGGVSTFVARAFGPAPGAVVGWFYLVAVANGQIIVPFTGAYYAAAALGLDGVATLVTAAFITVLGVGANLRGLRVSSTVQLVLSGGVALLLIASFVTAIPRISAANWTPFAPQGITAVGYTAIVIFFAFFGWEAIAHLSAEFKEPRDVMRSTLLSVGLVTVIYLGIAVAVIGTRTYGELSTDRVAVARLLADSLGIGASSLAGLMALVITLGTANAFIAAGSRLGYALARDGSLPAALAHLDERGVPRRAVLAVGAYALTGMLLTYIGGAGAEDLVIVSSSLGLATYVVGMAAAVRLLSRVQRVTAAVSCAACVGLFLFAGASLVVPLFVTAIALSARAMIGRRRAMASTLK